MAGLALLASTCLGAPSSAQKGETAARSAKITELSRAGKYLEALPLAQGQLQTLEQKYGPAHRDVAAALNNLAELYGHQGNDVEAEPLLKRAIAILEFGHGRSASGHRALTASESMALQSRTAYES